MVDVIKSINSKCAEQNIKMPHKQEKRKTYSTVCEWHDTQAGQADIILSSMPK